MFLWQQQITYNIPKFKIIDGELKENKQFIAFAKSIGVLQSE